VVSDDPEVLGYVDDRYRHRRGHHAAPDPQKALAERRVGEQEGDNDREQEVGEGEQGVGDQHQRAVELAAHVAGDQPQRHSDHEREDHRQDHDLDGRARPPDDAREHVGGLHRRSEQVLGVGRRLLCEAHAVGRHLIEPVRGDPRREDREDDEERDDREARVQDPARGPARLADRPQCRW
jgi:hypothetical protein